MSSGAITLQCPHCGGVFLTLQHGGIIEICPHCAVAAPRSLYTASSNPVGQRPKSDLPSTRHETAVPAAPPAVVASSPVLDAPFPPAPATAAPVVHAATMAQTITPHAAPTTSPAPEPTPIFESASWPPPSSASNPVATVHSSIPPVWPGLNLEPDIEGTNPFPTETVQQSSEPELVHRVAPKRRTPWFTYAMLTLLIGSVTWLAFQQPKPIHVPVTNLPATTPVAKTPAGTLESTPPVPTPPVPTPPAKEPDVEVKPAIPNASAAELAIIRTRAAEQHLSNITGEMLKGLKNAVTASDRLQWIDASEAQQTDIKKFFEARREKFEPLQWELSAGKVIVLPSDQETKLFRLTTTSCKEGAILHVRENNGRAKMRWSLFEQSHEKTYDRFLTETDGNGPARWFTLLCQRAHSFELKGATKDQWICFDAQGSLGAAGTGKIYINKDSPVGRLMEPKAKWGQLYLVELLLVKMGIEGRQLNVVLDCAGLQVSPGRR